MVYVSNLGYSTKAKNSVKTVTSANYTITNTDGLATILVSTSGTNRTITLPAVASSVGRTLTIKKVDSGVGAVTITPNGGTIDGAASFALGVQYNSIGIVSDGTNWSIEKVEHLDSLSAAFSTVWAASATWKEAATITLTPGRWLVSASSACSGPSTNATQYLLVISTASASNAGGTYGSNYIQIGPATYGASEAQYLVFTPQIITVSTNTPYYLNGNVTYSGTAGEFNGSIQAIKL